MLVFDGLGHRAWQRHRLHPAQHTELGLRITQAVEHHHPNQRLDIDGMSGAAKHTPKAIEAERVPEFSQRPDIAEITGRLEAQTGGSRRNWRALAGHAQQARDDGLQLRVQLIQTPQGGHRALLGPPGVVAIGLYELDVAA